MLHVGLVLQILCVDGVELRMIAKLAQLLDLHVPIAQIGDLQHQIAIARYLRPVQCALQTDVVGAGIQDFVLQETPPILNLVHVPFGQRIFPLVLVHPLPLVNNVLSILLAVGVILPTLVFLETEQDQQLVLVQNGDTLLRTVIAAS